MFRAFKSKRVRAEHFLCHTGQHNDRNMSDLFFQALGLPEPDFHLGVAQGTQTEQVAAMMVAFEKVIDEVKPDLVIVYGDVNSTLACGLVAAKMNIKIAHVEAGLRSFDRTMPEEINRMVTDILSDYLFVSEPSGLENLKNEGICDDKVFYAGNIMIDSLVFAEKEIEKNTIMSQLGLETRNYVLTTFHRPANVDDKVSLGGIIKLLNLLSKQIKVIWPVHPRTRKKISIFDFEKRINLEVVTCAPLGYFEFMNLQKNARLIITDSGGIQEESAFYGVPCITFRDNTERPVTLDSGTNFLAGTRITNASNIAEQLLSKPFTIGKVPELWDGQTAVRIVEILKSKMGI